MAYICKNCGKIITDKEYKKIKDSYENAMGCGCFLWLIVLLCFVSVILIPIAIILLGMAFDKHPTDECPYCHYKNCLIPDSTPIAKKLLQENYTQEEIEKIESQDSIEEVKKTQENKKIPIGCAIVLWFFAIIGIIGCLLDLFK